MRDDRVLGESARRAVSARHPGGTALVRCLLFAVLCALLESCSDMGSWDLFRPQVPYSTFRRKIKLTFDNSGQAEDLVDFTVLVVLDSTRIDTDLLDSSTAGVLFSNGGRTEVLDHEVDRWNPEGVSTIWVRVPRIEALRDDQHIWMYYGNHHDENFENPEGVWRNGYAAVWHFSEDGGDLRRDSTGNGHHGFPQNYEGDEQAVGRVGMADRMDGVDDYLICQTTPTLEITGSVTVSAWIRLDDGELAGYCRVLTKKPRFDSALGYGMWLHPDNEYAAILAAGDNHARADLAGNRLDDAWHHVAGTIAGTIGRVYFDGEDETDDGATNAIQAAGDHVTIGRIDDTGAGPGDYLQGVIDEARISSVARSADWIRAQYLSMTDSFIRFGPEESAR